MTDEEQECEITEEDKKIMRNATTEKCPDCGCEKVDKLVPISPPYDEILCECTDKKECHFTWTVLTDATKESKNYKKEITERESTCCCNEDLEKCPKCGHVGHYRIYRDNAKMTLVCKHEHFLKDPEIGRHVWCRLNQDQTEDFMWIEYGQQVLKSVSGKKEEEGLTAEEAKKNPAIGKNCYIAIRKDLDTTVWVLKDKTEYDRLVDLCDDAQYNSKLLSQYGFNKRTGEFDSKLFPVIKTDAQMEGVKSDIDRAVKSVDDLKRYKEYLSRKYDLLAHLDEANKCSRYSIYCPSEFTLLEEDEDDSATEHEDVFHWHSDETRS
jgi:hypothetical protein